MDSSNLKRVLISLGLLAALLSLVVLASGIGQLEFEPAMRLPSPQPPNSSGGPKGFANLDLDLMTTVYIGLTVLLLLVYSYLLWRYPQLRERAILPLAIITVLFVAAIVLMPPAQQVYLEETPEVEETPGLANHHEEETASAPDVEKVVPNPLLVNLVGLVAALAVVGLAGAGRLFWNRSRQRKSKPATELIIPARAALEEIRAGGDFHNAILRCYYQMQEIANEKYNLQRQAGVTPREFAQRLEEAGLPGCDVQRLTRLFEAVRYGSKTFRQGEETEAELCLTRVVAALGGRS